MILATVLVFASCLKEAAKRPPKQWNTTYDTPTYIYEHLNTLREGDTVMMWGWLWKVEYEDHRIHIATDSTDAMNYCVVSPEDMYMWLDCRGWLDTVTVCEKPCKVYATGIFRADDVGCKVFYYLEVPHREDVVFMPAAKGGAR